MVAMPIRPDYYVMRNSTSKLTLRVPHRTLLNHAPMSLNKRFQLGFKSTTATCFGGWFGWRGVLNGETVMGFSGDVIADLSDGIGFETDCGDEFVEHTYACIDVEAGTSIFLTQRIERNDTHAPTFSDAHILAADTTYSWNDIATEATDCQWHIDVPTLHIEDNCPDWDPCTATTSPWRLAAL